METVTDLGGSLDDVRRRLGALPDAPGVYLFRDAREQIIYVGKSIHLRQRVRSYFQQRAEESRKLRRLRQEARRLGWICTGSSSLAPPEEPCRATTSPSARRSSVAMRGETET